MELVRGKRLSAKYLVLRGGAIVACLLTSAAVRIASAQTYIITDLGTLPGGTSSRSSDINSWGQVTGMGSTSNGEMHAFRWDPMTGIADLGTLPNGTCSRGMFISDSGHVTGIASTSAGSQCFGDAGDHAFLWSASTGMIDLGVLPGGSFSIPTGINDSGRVVGHADASAGPTRSFLWSAASGMIDLGTFPFGDLSQAWDINASGQVVGLSRIPLDTDPSFFFAHAFLWSTSTGMTDLGTLGGFRSEAFAINDSGQVAGQADTANGEIHAFLWSASTGMIDLGALPNASPSSFGVKINASGQVAGTSSAGSGLHPFFWSLATGMVDLGAFAGNFSEVKGINASGQVVGGSDIGGRLGSHPFLWNPAMGAAGMVDLNSLLPPNSGWTLNFPAVGINNAGQITGSGSVRLGPTVANHAYVLSNPLQELQYLSSTISDFGLPSGMTTSLNAKVNAAIDGLSKKNTAPTCSALSDLNGQANAQAGKQLTEAQARTIINVAFQVRSQLGC